MNGPSLPMDAQQQLWRLGISVVDTEIKAIEQQAGMLTSVRLTNNQTVPADALFSRVSFRQACD